MPMHTMFIFLLLLSTWTISLMYIWMHSWGKMKLTVFVPAWSTWLQQSIAQPDYWLVDRLHLSYLVINSFFFLWNICKIQLRVSRMRCTTITIVGAISMAAFWKSIIMRWLIRYFFYNNLLIQRPCFPPKITFFYLFCINIDVSTYLSLCIC